MKRNSGRKRKGVVKGEGKSQGIRRTRNFCFFFFTFVTIGGWMYYKGILGYSFVIITF